MTEREILLMVDGVLETAGVDCDRQKSTLTFIRLNGFRKTYAAQDLYVCLGLVRAEFPNIKFLCKGAKLNIHPSRMSSQMSCGVVAYELKWGRPSEDEDMVNIFDYEENDITNDIQKQKEFYQRWINSLSE